MSEQDNELYSFEDDVGETSAKDGQDASTAP